MYSLHHIVKSLNGRMISSTSGICCCPAHDDKTPSLSLSFQGDKLLAKCFAGCSFSEIMSALKAMGLLDDNDCVKSSQPMAKVAKVNRNLEYAIQIWGESISAKNTPVETYLKARGYTDNIPSSLRYHSNLKHAPSGGYYHAMIAAVTEYPSNKIIAIHRTYLSYDSKQKAPVEPQKMMLGNVSGGAVMFGKLGSTLIIAEGIETALSVYQAMGVAVWATLSTSGMKVVKLPPVDTVPKLIIAADADQNNAGIKAANTLADREVAKGRKVNIAMPPKGDFNDLSMEGTLCL